MPPEKVTGPLGPRRAIGNAVRKLREDNGKTLNEVARDLMMSTSKLSRLENAQGKPLPRDIRDLIRYHGLEGTPLAARLERWVKDAQRPGWWTSYDDELIGRLNAHLACRASISLRLAPGDDAGQAFHAIRKHLLSQDVWGAEVTVSRDHQGEPFAVNTSGPVFEAFRRSRVDTWGSCRSKPAAAARSRSRPL